LVILEVVSTSEKLNDKNKKLNNTKQQYIEHNEAVHARLGLSVVSYDTQSANFTAREPKLRKGKYSLTIQWKIGVR